MEITEKAEFYKIMAALAEVFSKEISPQLSAIYFQALSGLSVDQVKAAVRRAVSECKFFPKPAELIEMAGGGLPQIEIEAMAQAVAVVAAIRKIGSYQTPNFKNPITNSLMETRWSWMQVCQMKESEIGWFVKEFVEAFQVFAPDQYRPQIAAPKEIQALLSGATKSLTTTQKSANIQTIKAKNETENDSSGADYLATAATYSNRNGGNDGRTCIPFAG